MLKFLHLLVIPVVVNITLVEAITREKNYASLISSICSLYDASSVIIIRNHPTEDINLLSKVMKELSILGISSQATNFQHVSKLNNYQAKYLKKQLYVLILATVESVRDLENYTQDIHVSEISWFIIFKKWGEEKPLEEYCSNPRGNPLNLRFDTRMIVKCYDDPILREWHSLYKNDTQIFDIATWNQTHGFKLLTKDKFLYSRRNNVGGITLRVSSINNSATVGDDKNIDGFYSKVFDSISKTINFKYNVTIIKSGGSKWNETGGVINELYKNKTDIALASLVMTKGRLSYVDFASPISTTPLVLCIKETNIKRQCLEYFKTFHYHIWMVILLFILTVPTILTIINVYENRDEFYNWRNHLQDNFFNVWRMFCLQGATDFPKDDTLRTTWFTMFATALIISLIYSGSLINYLTINSSVPVFTSLDNFIKDGTYKLVVIKNKFLHHEIQNKSSKNEVLLQLRKFLKHSNELPMNEFDAFTQMCNSRTAFLTTKEAVLTTNVSLYCKCKLFELTEAPKYISFALTKRNPYLDIINYQIIRLSTTGNLQYLRNTLQKVDNHHLNHQHYEKDENFDTSGIVLISQIIVTGIAVSFLIFFIEITYNMYNKKKNSQKFFKKLKLLPAKLRV
ncbi:uncharacterized protein LOC122502277 [Leptopilina heterotoma]|uniref:uncharacterized protein LOC122502277 n=1 Tax=Leptopilina heterotoma TaxID=63436 RepID=UPI001CA8E7EA|nr:uncharacterized protein LOC122502277 [Leptopilina heterotoma]